MLPDEQKLYDIEMKVGLLGKDVEQTDRLCEKLSESIEKLQEVNANLLRMITLHEQRHEQHEKVETDLKEDIKDLHDRIDQVERHISERIDALRADLMNHKKHDNVVGDTLKEIDKYKWMILGAAIAIGWIIGNVNLGVLGTLFK
jgi:predicted  nucleic acid-binding Zn-ribbon protein